jgi:hypothetical protein
MPKGLSEAMNRRTENAMTKSAKRLVVPCINGVSSNPVEGRTKHCQLKDLIITLFGLIFRLNIYIYI